LRGARLVLEGNKIDASAERGPNAKDQPGAPVISVEDRAGQLRALRNRLAEALANC
jgi:hypothetical protein